MVYCRCDMLPYSLRIQPPLKALHYWDVLQTYHLVCPSLSCYNWKTSVFKNIYFFIFTSLSRAGWNKTKPLLLMANPYPFAPTCSNETSSTTLYSQTRYLCIKTGRQLQEQENNVVLLNTSLPGTVSSNWGKATSVPTTPRSSLCSWYKQT